MASVLVAYATTYGSTREVAEAIAATLCEHDLDVDVQAAGEVDDASGYAAVVLGGALYFFRWHKDARRFLDRHRGALEATPVAVFAMGPFNDTGDELDGARKQLDRALARQRWLTPVSIAIFGGRFDPTVLRFPHSNPAMKKMPPSDIRDWTAIRTWADTLPAALGLTGPATDG